MGKHHGSAGADGHGAQSTDRHQSTSAGGVEHNALSDQARSLTFGPRQGCGSDTNVRTASRSDSSTSGGTTHPTEGGTTHPTEGGNNPPPTDGGNNPPPTEGGGNPPPTEGGGNPPPKETSAPRRHHHDYPYPDVQIVGHPWVRFEADNGDESTITTSQIGGTPPITVNGRKGVTIQ